jgi:hypothetical protein
MGSFTIIQGPCSSRIFNSSGKILYLLTDFAGSQLLKRNSQLLGQNRIIDLTFPAHTTHLFQALDLIFFGAMRNNKDSLVREPEITSVHGQI